MGLKACKQCGKEVSTDAKRCPQCGAKRPTGGVSFLAGCLTIFVVLIVIGSLVPGSPTPESSSDGPAPAPQTPPSGYTVAGRQGVMVFVSVDAASKENEDVYRGAVAALCAGKPVCQVQFWVGVAPSRLPFTDAQVAAMVVNWNKNTNTGLRRWLVNCKTSSLFSSERECM
jgi:hypothetical protein